jgi:hypothetical protein
LIVRFDSERQKLLSAVQKHSGALVADVDRAVDHDVVGDWPRPATLV